jgi:hypothetical protein
LLYMHFGFTSTSSSLNLLIFDGFLYYYLFLL